ncbi:hypothetical protein ACLB2K_064993 [Fragaria x ananassa]
MQLRSQTLCNACGLRRKKLLTKLDAESRAKKGMKTKPRKPRIHSAGSTTNRGRGLLGIETVMKKRRSYNRKMWTMEKDQQLAVAALLELAGSALVELSDSMSGPISFLQPVTSGCLWERNSLCGET